MVMELWQLDLKLSPQLPKVIQFFLHNCALLVLIVIPVQTSETCLELFVRFSLHPAASRRTYRSLSPETLSSASSSWSFS